METAHMRPGRASTGPEGFKAQVCVLGRYWADRPQFLQLQLEFVAGT